MLLGHKYMPPQMLIRRERVVQSDMVNHQEIPFSIIALYLYFYLVSYSLYLVSYSLSSVACILF